MTAEPSSEASPIEPEKMFSRPSDILRREGLAKEQKAALLARWRRGLLDRLRATGEGMAPPAGQTADEAALVEEIGQAEEILRKQ